MNVAKPSFSGLLPHPPIILPEVGGERIAECRATVEACREFARRLVRSAPDRLLLVSPHAPRRELAFGIAAGETLSGDLGRFGAPLVSIGLENDRTLIELLRRNARAREIETFELTNQHLDHGAVVPLRFLIEAGFRAPTCVISLPLRHQDEDLVKFGQVIARTLAELGGRPALIASGDMSHGTTADGPAGFCPRGKEFDSALRELLDQGRLDRIVDLEQDLRRFAAEDATDSALLVASALDFQSRGAETLSYEHPFGVGYLVSIFYDGSQPEAHSREGLPELARAAIRARLAGCDPNLPIAAGELRRQAAAFVTLRTREGELRGCMGTVRPQTEDLVHEVADRALSAAFEDPRFPPVTREELERLSIEVSVLGPDEPVGAAAELDPQRFGVAITDDLGRRAVLLPGVEGVDTVEAQLRITRSKAGIPDHAKIQIRRFEVIRILEQSRPDTTR